MTDETITAHLVDGRVISVPLAWSWRLSDATRAQRANYQLIGDGLGVHWPDIDEDLSVEGMLHGIPAHRPRPGPVRKKEPSTKLALKIAGTNLGDAELADLLGRRLIETFRDSRVYHLEPREGIRVKAAIDWIILSRVADVAGIASLLWLLFEKVIRPRKTMENQMGLLVAIDQERGLQWLLGQDLSEREAFISDFVSKVSEFQCTERAQVVFRETTADLETSDIWISKAAHGGEKRTAPANNRLHPTAARRRTRPRVSKKR
ncbi:MAG: hypothetical protein A3F69_03765 [Acidobacteria bacterium RIFCSPLOWO2_12_FULL_66_10]|nr:MAG: hypothetical protein A3F69_03765 [Acidobacteria bacterium RIFCSPLOWO2_12_FULL_66_10]